MKLSKQDVERRDEYVKELRAAADVVEDAINVFNASMRDSWETAKQAIGKYNEIIAGVAGWRDDLVNQLESDIEEKSERWQDSEKGQSANDWKSEWENLDLETYDIDMPDEVESETLSHADDLEAVASQSEEE